MFLNQLSHCFLPPFSLLQSRQCVSDSESLRILKAGFCKIIHNSYHLYVELKAQMCLQSMSTLFNLF